MLGATISKQMIFLLLEMVLASTWKTYLNVSLQEQDYSGYLLNQRYPNSTEIALALDTDDLYIEELSSREFIIYSSSSADKDELEKRISNHSNRTGNIFDSIYIKEVTFESIKEINGCTELMMFDGQINEYQKLNIFITAQRFHVRVHGPNRWNAVGLGTSMTNVDA